MRQPKAVRWEARDLVELLAVRYPAPEWAFFPQARNSTGYVSRTADAVAMNLWPSRGMELHGFEVKVDRGDWLKELKSPEKATKIQQYCDRWWIVAPKEIVGPAELPSTWGLLLANSGHLRCQVEAPKLQAVELDRGFVAALLRNAASLNTVSENRLKEEFERGVKHGKTWPGESAVADLIEMKASIEEDGRKLHMAASRAERLASNLEFMTRYAEKLGIAPSPDSSTGVR